MRKVFIYEYDGYCPIEAFFQKADKKIQNKLKFQLEYIKDERNIFTEPYVKHFSIEKYRKLYELRIKAAGTMVRVIFYEHNGEIILLHAFYKKDRKDTEKALESALKILHTAVLKDGEINKEFRKELIA